MSFRNDEQLEQLTRSVKKEFSIDFSVLNLELNLPEDKVPLNWFLTKKQSNGIRKHANKLLTQAPEFAVEEDFPTPDGKNKKRLSTMEKLLQWWGPDATKK